MPQAGERAGLRHVRYDEATKRDVWEIRIYLGRHADGRQRYQRYRFKGTERQAEKWRDAKVEQSRRKELPSVGGRETVEGWMTRFLRDTVGQSVRARTLVGYQEKAATYLYPKLGVIRLRDLDAPTVQALIAEMTAPDRKGGPLSPRTVRLVIGLLRHALAGAKAVGLLSHNPIGERGAVRIPQRQAPTEAKVKFLSPEEGEAFLDVASQDTYAALWRVALRSGMRPSEILALRWNDYQRTARTLRVDESLQPDGSFAPPKTASGRRVIHLAPDVVLALDGHRAQVARERVPRGGDLIFQSATGTPIDHNNLAKRCRDLCAKAGVPVVGPYALRHTAATMLLHAGVDAKVASAILGHANVMLFWNTYSHVTENLTEQAVALTSAFTERVRAGRSRGS